MDVRCRGGVLGSAREVGGDALSEDLCGGEWLEPLGRALDQGRFVGLGEEGEAVAGAVGPGSHQSGWSPWHALRSCFAEADDGPAEAVDVVGGRAEDREGVVDQHNDRFALVLAVESVHVIDQAGCEPVKRSERQPRVGTGRLGEAAGVLGESGVDAIRGDAMGAQPAAPVGPDGLDGGLWVFGRPVLGGSKAVGVGTDEDRRRCDDPPGLADRIDQPEQRAVERAAGREVDAGDSGQERRCEDPVRQRPVGIVPTEPVGGRRQVTARAVGPVRWLVMSSSESRVESRCGAEGSR